MFSKCDLLVSIVSLVNFRIHGPMAVFGLFIAILCGVGCIAMPLAIGRNPLIWGYVCILAMYLLAILTISIISPRIVRLDFFGTGKIEIFDAHRWLSCPVVDAEWRDGIRQDDLFGWFAGKESCLVLEIPVSSLDAGSRPWFIFGTRYKFIVGQTRENVEIWTSSLNRLKDERKRQEVAS